ncbi:MAG: methionine adenosyltransferase [Alphaproteobacteria bacterium]|nr:methionine adenosyltransferase [Alphaproteobacteria bacterium]MDB3954837.1 methionine adenosyltransferase [Alphaproteobacteria bacterium]
MNNNYLFTSESVSEGHPDKICDQISDAIVDAYLDKSEQKDQVRVACETMVTTNRVILAGEIRGSEIKNEEIEDITRKIVKEIGYEQENFHWKNFDFSCFLHAQSIDIAQGVDANDARTEGAGDQGIMFGYACTETKEFMPAPIQYSHQILEKLAKERKSGNASGILPDSKSQVTLIYNEDNKPIGCDNIVVSTQHTSDLNKKNIFDYLYPIIESSLPPEWIPTEDKIFINPTGKFEIGGPDGDAGLTGRKIIVDTYGGACPHGGGAFSGKDPSKVDRSAAYAARYVAKNIVYAGLAERCTIQLAYAIGMVEPLSVYINTYGTGKLKDTELVSIINKNFDLTPRGIREMLNLSNVNYLSTAAYGHFGRESSSNQSFTWEKTDKAKLILESVS